MSRYRQVRAAWRSGGRQRTGIARFGRRLRATFILRPFRTRAPGEALLAGAIAGEVAAAHRAAVRRRSHPQQQHGPQRRAIVLFAPGGKFLPVAARAACEFPRTLIPYAGGPTRAAARAPQRINTE